METESISHKQTRKKHEKKKKMKPHMNTDKHGFLRQSKTDYENKFLSSSDFICVNLCQSVAKNSSFREFLCLFVAKK